MSLTLQWQSRTYGISLSTPKLQWTVERFGFSAQGGPTDAVAVAQGDGPLVGQLLQMLRCPVEFVTERGGVSWWGFLYAVTIQVGALEIGITLEDMANIVSIAYGQTEEGTATKTRATTPWAIDDLSVATYGPKERRESLDQGTEALAVAIRDAILNQRRWPQGTMTILDSAVGVPTAHCEFKGWFSTLGWRYYENTATTNVVTTQQIRDIVAAVGPFFASVLIQEESVVPTQSNRDGDTRADKIVTDLLNVGSASSARLLATVEPSRILRIYPEPTYSTLNALWISTDGTILHPSGTPLPIDLNPVGQWVRVRDLPFVIPGTIGDPTRQFLETAEFDVANNHWRVTPRGVQDVWDLLTFGI